MKFEVGLVDGQVAWDEAGRRLREVEPERFGRLLALARAYVSLHDRELEDVEVYQSRLAQISPGDSKASA